MLKYLKGNWKNQFLELLEIGALMGSLCGALLMEGDVARFTCLGIYIVILLHPSVTLYSMKCFINGSTLKV